MPNPTSCRPSRIVPGAARLSGQRNAEAPWAKHCFSERDENGRQPSESSGVVQRPAASGRSASKPRERGARRVGEARMKRGIERERALEAALGFGPQAEVRYLPVEVRVPQDWRRGVKLNLKADASGSPGR